MSLLLAVTGSAVTTKNYYSGGTANLQRLTRGIGWVSVWILFLFG
jgi:hypothetical protein